MAKVAAWVGDPANSVRSLMHRFVITVLAITDDPCDDLARHGALMRSPLVVPTFRPDRYLEPRRPGWGALVDRLGEVSG